MQCLFAAQGPDEPEEDSEAGQEVKSSLGKRLANSHLVSYTDLHLALYGVLTPFAAPIQPLTVAGCCGGQRKRDMFLGH
jgi:hypothetical protein